MASFRDIKRRARRQLHQRMADRVLYVPTLQGVPQPATVRLHLSFDALGEMRRAGFAEQQEYNPEIVFMASETVPRRDGLVITEDMGVWRVSNTLPPDDITITAEASRLSETQIRGLGWDPDAPWAGFPAPEPT